jgi:hypothetical protein
MSEFIKLTGLWQNEKGNLTGALGGGKIVIVKNHRKEPGSRQPDYEMLIVKQEPKKDGYQRVRPPGDDAFPKQRAQEAMPYDDDEPGF